MATPFGRAAPLLAFGRATVLFLLPFGVAFTPLGDLLDVFGDQYCDDGEMARKVLVSLIDDFDGKPANETVQFELDGVNYEIDLSAQNAKRLRLDLGPWVQAGRRIGGRRRRGVGTGVTSVERKHASEIREWAHKSGHAVAKRGRIPSDVIEAFRAAHEVTSNRAPAVS